jgi:predicted nucleic acid-binding protein
MNVFVDANVIINVLNKEYPAFDHSARFLSLAQDKRFTFFTSSLSIAICWFFAEKKSGRSLANRKIEQLLLHFRITECGEEEVRKALADKRADDMEDAIQVYSALRNSCSHLVTNNLNDFHFSSLEVLEPLSFLEQHGK